MSTFKCKMCGGALEIENNVSIATCEYCGTQQTLPRLDDERRVNMYDRANHFRRNNEFDKAAAIYEQILNEDSTDAEAYWSLVLCRYGIEYVEDPTTHKRVPTVNRAQFTAIFDDDNYKSALKHADIHQRILYEEEAKAINEIQKGILAISQQEAPFDVFICYKETDSNGRRTQDSVFAQDLYYQLTKEGFKVFFAKITLEDKLGSAYEPYIFAALNSAKVMVVLGTKPEHFNAVWVKNEWSRFLALVKSSKGQKVLIPAYRDMDPYDMPEEFSRLQAQDMSKLGFMQDLIRGIKKLVVTETPVAVKETVVVSGTNGDIMPLLKRGQLYLEDKDWARADEYFERVLDISPECADAYLGKLMAELRVSQRKDLGKCETSFRLNSNYAKVIRYGDEKLVAELKKYLAQTNEHIKLLNNERTYQQALNLIRGSNDVGQLLNAQKLFASIAGYKEADQRAKYCAQRARAIVDAQNDEILNESKEVLELTSKLRVNKALDEVNLAMKNLSQIRGWKDADDVYQQCAEKLNALQQQRAEAVARLKKEQEERDRLALEKEKRNRKIALIILAAIVAVVIVIICVVSAINTADQKKRGGVEYTLTANSNAYSVSACDESVSGEVSILAEYKGKPVTEIGELAFYNCKNITSITMPNSITSISEDAFACCAGLINVTISASVTKIEDSAFFMCESLAKVNYLGTIDQWVQIKFSDFISNPLYYAHNLYINNTLITNVTLTTTTVSKYAFCNCRSLKSIVISSGVTSIGDNAFRDCSSLASVNIPNSVTSIGNAAFSGCSGLTSITIPNSVTSIGSSAFSGCSGLKNITIPNSVTSIGSYVFSNCSSLTIYCEAESKPSGWDYWWNYRSYHSSSQGPVVWGYVAEE